MALDPIFGPISAFLASVTWAIGSAQYSRMNEHHSAFAVNFARALFALPLFALLVFVSSGGWSAGIQEFRTLEARHIYWFTVSMIASYGLGDVLFLWSTARIGVPAALAIASCYPLWTAIAGVLFRGETLNIPQTLGLVTVVAGVVGVILSAPKKNSLKVSGSGTVLRLGVLLAFLTSFMWALNGFAVSHAGKDLSMPVANTLRMALALGLSTIIGRVLAPRSSILIPARTLKAFVWVLALEAFGGSCLYVYGLARSPLAIGATLSSLAPVLSVPVAWGLGLEKPSVPRTLAVLVTALGILLLVGGASL
ncbi:MAG: hypothetical protein A2X94_16535 [Bdellovibrionales bacterium GWB1_55_8]|nr:MAG: hypothetical protein A2X94_16535 [Bdellovibrionales bacterium GWB1_55_8]